MNTTVTIKPIVGSTPLLGETTKDIIHVLEGDKSTAEIIAEVPEFSNMHRLGWKEFPKNMWCPVIVSRDKDSE